MMADSVLEADCNRMNGSPSGECMARAPLERSQLSAGLSCASEDPAVIKTKSQAKVDRANLLNPCVSIGVSASLRARRKVGADGAAALHRSECVPLEGRLPCCPIILWARRYSIKCRLIGGGNFIIILWSKLNG